MAVRSLFRLCPSSVFAFSLPLAEKLGLILLRASSLESVCTWEVDGRAESAAAGGGSSSGGEEGGEGGGIRELAAGGLEMELCVPHSTSSMEKKGPLLSS